MQTKIQNEAGLKSVATILHDARFTAGTINFDAAMNAFALKCWVLDSKINDAEVARGWQAYELYFSDVLHCKIDVRESVFYYEIGTIKFNKPDLRLDLITHYAIEISLRIGKLEGTLTRLDERRESWPKL